VSGERSMIGRGDLGVLHRYRIRWAGAFAGLLSALLVGCAFPRPASSVPGETEATNAAVSAIYAVGDISSGVHVINALTFPDCAEMTVGKTGQDSILSMLVLRVNGRWQPVRTHADVPGYPADGDLFISEDSFQSQDDCRAAAANPAIGPAWPQGVAVWVHGGMPRHGITELLRPPRGRAVGFPTAPV
jgi:hypothetical protein